MIVPISVRHHGDHEAAQTADGVGTDLAVISTVVGPIQSRPVEEPHGIAEIDAVLADVHLILGFVPLEPRREAAWGQAHFRLRGGAGLKSFNSSGLCCTDHQAAAARPS